MKIAAALALTTALAAPAFAENGRLPGGIVPLAYAIRVDPNATALTFQGAATATVQVTRATRTITLNAVDLDIRSAKLDGTIPAKIAVDAAGQTATLTFAKMVGAGRHTLAFDYGGKIYQAATGMFAIDYANAGKQERMLVTQFEAADARRLAPMWDEPGFKTPFTLSVTAPAGQTAFSNMPVAAKTPYAGGKTLYRFQPTPKMSSYLMFLGVGNIDRKTVMAGKTEIGVITRKGVVDQGDYALASAKRILTAYNDYFGTPYPLPKLDMIAGPGSSQFFGAMENWGAIFYFEPVLLMDPKFQSESQKQGVFGVVAHEMAHQWFGDLVTMSWWDDLWLNEGYASWMASKISNDLNPDWAALSQTLAFDRQGAMSRDARLGTHPIVQHVETPDQINQAFDDITYRKGEAVIRMLEGAVGPDVFRGGVRRYMAEHKYGNAVTDQLWSSISASAGSDVSTYMHSFTLQAGVPMIVVSEPVCGGGGQTAINLTQSRFGLDASGKKPQTWVVPVNVGLVGSTAMTKLQVSGGKPATATIEGCGTPIVNAGQSAYFRTLYTDAHFEKLRAAYRELKLDDQLGLLADSYGLGNSADAPIERYLGLLDTLTPDADPLVWELALGQLNGMDTMLRGAPEQTAFEAKANRILTPVLARIGTTARAGESPSTTQLREALAPSLANFGNQTAVADARRLARLNFDRPDAVPAAQRLPALRAFAYNATPEDWDYLHAKALAEPTPVAKQRYYNLLGAAKDDALAQRALDLAMTSEVPLALKGSVFQAVAQNHPAMAFDYAVAHKEQISAALEASTASRFVVGLPASSGDPAVAERVDAYAKANLPEGSRQSAVATIAVINYRAALRQRQAAAIGAWAAR
ncbi:Aminopeptidase [Sphingomonas antarctica]|uniref:M1 family metallopeptidase n=1 Tax=Sphingomonas antarctica TaxID=2040274 RepID=UPI0039EA85D0